MKVKTSELIGAALDWAVAKCEKQVPSKTTKEPFLYEHRLYLQDFQPSTDWTQGGPIIEREDIQWCRLNGQIEAWSGFDYIEWRSNWESEETIPYGPGFGSGPTILIAAMRCRVTSKLGDEIELPGYLLRS